MLPMRNISFVDLVGTCIPESREKMKPTRRAGSCGRSLTHCPKLLVGAYTSAGGAAAVLDAAAALAGAGAVAFALAGACAGAVDALSPPATMVGAVAS